jgi:hypothetical protein
MNSPPSIGTPLLWLSSNSGCPFRRDSFHRRQILNAAHPLSKTCSQATLCILVANSSPMKTNINRVALDNTFDVVVMIW